MATNQLRNSTKARSKWYVQRKKKLKQNKKKIKTFSTFSNLSILQINPALPTQIILTSTFLGKSKSLASTGW